MKKSVLKTFSIILIISSLLCVFTSCKKEKEEEEGYVYGLHFDLGEGYNSLKIANTDAFYTNGEADFFFRVFSGEGLEELGYLPDISVERYTQQFCLENSLDPFNYEYDAERNITTLNYVYKYSSEEESYMAPEFYYHMIMRGTSHLYIITMTCDEADRETYEPIFKGWVENIYAD